MSVKLPSFYLTIVFCFGLLFFLFGRILAQSPGHNETRKIGIIESVIKISALLLPPVTEKKEPEDEEEKVVYGTVLEHPRCPSTCSATWMADGWCDSACFSPDCGSDGGDCKDWCAGDCKPAWVGDGYCDVDCFRQECEWDKGDCAQNYTRADLHHPLPSHKKFDYSKCPESCKKDVLHDGTCDEQCNVAQCNFDGGDCYHQCAPFCYNAWLGDGGCDEPCDVAACGFDKGDCKICKPGCEPGMVGNGICDIGCQSEECQTDMGDCFGVCWVAEKIDYETEPFFFPHCRTEWKGDGYCDCFCMNQDCDFDYGDCQGYDCSIEFALLKELNTKMNATDYPFPSSKNNRTNPLAGLVTELTGRRLDRMTGKALRRL